jgi:hypothetical protein
MSIKSLSRLLGIEETKLDIILNEMEEVGIFSRRESDNAIYSKRMVRDQKLIDIRRESGKLGGNPTLVNQKPTKSKKQDNLVANQMPTPSSSSSFSFSSSSSFSNTDKIKQKRKKMKVNFSECEYFNDPQKFISDWFNTSTAKQYPNVSAESVYEYVKLKGNEYKYIDWLSAAQVWVKRSPESNEWKQKKQINLPNELNTQANRRIAEAMSRNLSALGTKENKS